MLSPQQLQIMGNEKKAAILRSHGAKYGERAAKARRKGNELKAAQFERKAADFERRAVKAEKGGCFVATSVYGSYEHPQVRVLRQFRDDRLAKSLAGRWFIRFYYAVSPALAERMKSMPAVRRTLRPVFDRLIASKWISS